MTWKHVSHHPAEMGISDISSTSFFYTKTVLGVSKSYLTMPEKHAGLGFMWQTLPADHQFLACMLQGNQCNSQETHEGFNELWHVQRTVSTKQRSVRELLAKAGAERS